MSCKQCIRSTSHEVFEGRTPSFASFSVVQEQNFRAYQRKWLPLWWPGKKKSGRDVVWESPHYSQWHVGFFIFIFLILLHQQRSKSIIKYIQHIHGIIFMHPYNNVQRLRWSRGSVLAFSTQVRGFKPGRSRRIF